MFPVTESPKGKEKSGGMAYEVILKPAAGDSPAPRPKSPPKERPLSQELIEKKLKEAEERRQVRQNFSWTTVSKDSNTELDKKCGAPKAILS